MEYESWKLEERLKYYENDVNFLIKLLDITAKYISVENQKGIWAKMTNKGQCAQKFKDYCSIIRKGRNEKERINACTNLEWMINNKKNKDYIKEKEMDGYGYSYLKSEIDDLISYDHTRPDIEIYKDIHINIYQLMEKYVNESDNSLQLYTEILGLIGMTLNTIITYKNEIESKSIQSRNNPLGEANFSENLDNGSKNTKNSNSNSISNGNSNSNSNNVNSPRNIGNRNQTKQQQFNPETIKNKIRNYEYITEEEYNFITRENPDFRRSDQLYSYKNYISMVDYQNIINKNRKKEDIIKDTQDLLEAAHTLITLATKDLLGKTLYDKDNIFKSHQFVLENYIDDYKKLYSSYIKKYREIDEFKKNQISSLIENNYGNVYLSILGIDDAKNYSPENLNPDRIIRKINKNVKEAMLGEEFKNIIEPDDKSIAVNRITRATKLMDEYEIVSIYTDARKNAEDNVIQGLYYHEMDEKQRQRLYDRLAILQDEFSTVLVGKAAKESDKNFTPEEFEDLKMKICKEKFWEKVKFVPNYSFNPDDLDVKNPALKNYDFKGTTTHEEKRTETKENPYDAFDYLTLALAKDINKSEEIAGNYQQISRKIAEIKRGESKLSSEELLKFNEDVKKEAEKLEQISRLKEIVYRKRSEYELLNDEEQILFLEQYKIISMIISKLSRDNTITVNNRNIDLFEASEKEISEAIEEVSNISFRR